jgi:hypothetical protein
VARLCYTAVTAAIASVVWGEPVKLAVLIFLLAVGGLYLFRENLPAGWFSFDYATAVSTPSAFGKLGQSVDGAMRRSANSF